MDLKPRGELFSSVIKQKCISLKKKTPQSVFTHHFPEQQKKKQRGKVKSNVDFPKRLADVVLFYTRFSEKVSKIHRSI